MNKGTPERGKEKEKEREELMIVMTPTNMVRSFAETMIPDQIFLNRQSKIFMQIIKLAISQKNSKGNLS